MREFSRPDQIHRHMVEEAKQRQFQLQRLEEEGHHVCQAKAGNEVILFQAVEDEIDRTPDSLQSETGNSSKEERMVNADIESGDRQGGKGVSEALPQVDREFLIYENEYETARIVLDAITAVCLFDWLEQLKRLNVNDSLTWKFVQHEREIKQNG